MNVEDIRKVAMQQKGREALEERFGAPQLGALEHVLLHKQAGADETLLKVACVLDPNQPLALYEALGGGYKKGTAP